MIFAFVMALATACGFGLGMAVALFQMASEPCSDRPPPHPVDEAVELRESA